MDGRNKTRVRVLSKTGVKTLVIVGLAAGGIAAAMMVSLIGSKTPGESVACGEYGQSICLPCRESLIVSDTRTCTCEKGLEYDGKQCYAPSLVDISLAKPLLETELIPENFLGDESSSLLAQAGVTFPGTENNVNTISFSLQKDGRDYVPQGVKRYRLRVTNRSGEMIGDDLSIPASSYDPREGRYGITFDEGTTKKSVLFSNLPSEVSFELIADHTMDALPMAGTSQVWAIRANGKTPDGTRRTFTSRPASGQGFSVTLKQDKNDVVAKPYGDSPIESDVIIKNNEAAPVPLARVEVVLPAGATTITEAIFQSPDYKPLSEVFSSFNLEITNRDGKRIGGYGVWAQRLEGADSIHFDSIAGKKTDVIFKDLPSGVPLLFQVTGAINVSMAKKALPVTGVLNLQDMYARGGDVKHMLRPPVRLQEYSVRGEEAKSVDVSARKAERSIWVISDEPGVSQVIQIGEFMMTLPEGTETVHSIHLKDIGIKALEFKGSPFEKVGLRVRVPDPANNEKWHAETIWSTKRPPGDEFYFGSPELHIMLTEYLFKGLPTGVPLVIEVLAQVDEKGRAALPTSGQLRLADIDASLSPDKRGSKQHVYFRGALDLSPYIIKKEERSFVPPPPSCGVAGRDLCPPGTSGMTNGCILPARPNGEYVYFTNPADVSTLGSSRPNFDRCPGDKNPMKWDVAPWRGYTTTEAPASLSDPDKCYDEYHAMWAGFTAFNPTFAIYTKRTAKEPTMCVE